MKLDMNIVLWEHFKGYKYVHTTPQLRSSSFWCRYINYFLPQSHRSINVFQVKINFNFRATPESSNVTISVQERGVRQRNAQIVMILHYIHFKSVCLAAESKPYISTKTQFAVFCLSVCCHKEK